MLILLMQYFTGIMLNGILVLNMLYCVYMLLMLGRC